MKRIKMRCPAHLKELEASLPELPEYDPVIDTEAREAEKQRVEAAKKLKANEILAKIRARSRAQNGWADKVDDEHQS